MNRAAMIGGLIDAVRGRLNRAAASGTAARCLIFAAGACVVWGLGWRAFGYAAPWLGYGVIALAGVVVWAVGWAGSRRTRIQAAMVADDVFGLKDGLLSWLGFRGRMREGEVFELHERSLAERVSTLDPARVPVRSPQRSYAAGGVLAAVAAFLAFLPHSEAVRTRLAGEEMTALRSAEVRRQLDDAVEDLIAELSEEEREVLDAEKLRELAKQIEETKDQREGEMQIARFEHELAKAMQGLEARQDEAVLKLAADELAKASMADLRQLGKQLDAKEYQKAREEMKEMKPGAKPKMTPEEIEQLRKNAAKARDMAKRMADGARQRDFGKAPKPGDHADAEAMPMADGEQRPMQEMLEELDALAGQLGQMLEKGEFDPDAEEMALLLDGKMDELGKRLGLLGARQKARGKLNALRQGMAGARQFAQGKAQALGLAQSMAQSDQAGGRDPGTGSVESRREERDELRDNGQLSQLQGQQNSDGASSNSVESADSGTGIAGRAAVDRQRDFRQQMESLVRRDDIPEELKLGVREYFERIHEIE